MEDKGTATIQEVRKADPANNIFDGQKPDLYVNTGKLNGKHFLVKVHVPGAEPTLIAIHL
jgi:hypothetical protein